MKEIHVGKLDDWDEVPQTVYLSWSEARKLDYCMRRDLHTASHIELNRDMSRGRYLERAAYYKEQLNTLLNGG